MLSIVASMVVLGPSPGGWRWQPWCSMEIYVLMALHRCENSFCLAAFTVVTVLFFSYMNRTNCSIFSDASCDRFAVSVPTSKKANATAGNAVHVFQAFSFSVPAKEWDRVTLRYNVKGWQSSRFICTKTWSNRVDCNVSEMFSSPKFNPQLFHLYFFNDRYCKSAQNVRLICLNKFTIYICVCVCLFMHLCVYKCVLGVIGKTLNEVF